MMCYYTYRCRRCSNLFRSDASDAKPVPLLALDLYNSASNNGARVVNPLDTHICPDGGIGVGDLAGMEFVGAQPKD